MERDGLWRLFFATGLPEAYLAIRRREGEEERAEPTALTAFRPLNAQKRPL